MISARTRILIGIGLLFLAIGMGYLLYRVFFASNTITDRIQPPRQGQVQNPDTFPISGDRTPIEDTEREPDNYIPLGETDMGNDFDNIGSITDIVERPIPNRVANMQGGPDGIRYYNENDGYFYRLDNTGTLEQLSSQVFFNVSSVSWAPQGDKAVLEYPDGSNVIYNFDTESQVTLPRHWEDFAFSSQGNEIVAKSLGLTEENRWLVRVDDTGNNISLITPLGNNADKVTVEWSPNNQVIAFSRTGQAIGQDSEEVLLIGQNNENFKSLRVEGRGFTPTWSPTGEKILYSVYSARSDYKPELWVVNGSGNAIGTNRRLLNVNTWADKCTFGSSDDYVYCAVPSTLERGAGFAPEISNTTGDILYRIDTRTGSRTPIPLDDDIYVIDTLEVSTDENTVYFTDKNRPGLFSADF